MSICGDHVLRFVGSQTSLSAGPTTDLESIAAFLSLSTTILASQRHRLQRHNDEVHSRQDRLHFNREGSCVRQCEHFPLLHEKLPCVQEGEPLVVEYGHEVFLRRVCAEVWGICFQTEGYVDLIHTTNVRSHSYSLKVNVFVDMTT